MKNCGMNELTSQCWHLQIVHLRERHHERELVVMYVELEEGASSHNLQRGKHDLADIDVGDEDVPRHLADVLQEG